MLASGRISASSGTRSGAASRAARPPRLVEDELGDDDVLQAAADRLEHRHRRCVDSRPSAPAIRSCSANDLLADRDAGGACGDHVAGLVEHLVERRRRRSGRIARPRDTSISRCCGIVEPIDTTAARRAASRRTGSAARRASGPRRPRRRPSTAACAASPTASVAHAELIGQHRRERRPRSVVGLKTTISLDAAEARDGPHVHRRLQAAPEHAERARPLGASRSSAAAEVAAVRYAVTSVAVDERGDPARLPVEQDDDVLDTRATARSAPCPSASRRNSDPVAGIAGKRAQPGAATGGDAAGRRRGRVVERGTGTRLDCGDGLPPVEHRLRGLGRDEDR